LRHSVSQNGQASITSMLDSVRYMSSSKLFIAGLSYSTDDQARVITDRETGRSRVFLGLLTTPAMNLQSQHCLRWMARIELNGRIIRLSYANDRLFAPRS
jgi:hypothetical protein